MSKLPIRLLTVFLLVVTTIGVVFAAARFPTGFEDTLLARIEAPIALATVPDGRLLITTQPGQVFVYTNAALLQQPALDLSRDICSDKERGMLGIAVDPQFNANRFVYLYYTFDKHNTKETDAADCPRQKLEAETPVNRVSRFVLQDNNQIDPGTEVILIDNIPSINANHDGGVMRFGKDGYLYVAIGDGGCSYLMPTAKQGKCQATNDASRDRSVLLGKILRITRDGGIPADNPFVATGVRCYDPAPGGNQRARNDQGLHCQETYAWGLRNPFRMAVDPTPGSQLIYINDVGQNDWEEINLLQPGADYGWNCMEAARRNSSTGACASLPQGLTPPIYSYNHAVETCKSITAAAFIPPGIWPAQYDSRYLFGDYHCGKMWLLTNTAGTYDASSFAVDLGGSSIVDMVFGAYGDSQALYYTTYDYSQSPNGELRRLTYVGSANRSPSAEFQASSPTFGAGPLTVSFDASASSDPDSGDTLTYLWDFGDGQTAESTQPTISHTYQQVGAFFAVLRVRDNHGVVSLPASAVRVDVGNSPPEVTLVSPSSGQQFTVGQQITLSATAFDAQDGLINNPQQIEWRVLQMHNDHFHPFLSETGNNLSISAPAPEDLFATDNSYLAIAVTVTDSHGRETVLNYNLMPQKISLTFQSVPPGMQLTIDAGTDGHEVTAPYTMTSWPGYQINLSAPTQTGPNGEQLSICRWSNGGSPAQQLLTPSTSTTYIATFGANGVCPTAAPDQRLFVPHVTR